ncbi:MAG: hypothetical protein ACTSWY_04945 [Promethearchaeota archaeon]
MEVKIDYDMELMNTEKQKINWLVEEFNCQFENKNTFKAQEKKLSNRILEFYLEIIDIQNPKILNFFQTRLERIESKYPVLFK